MSKTDKCAALIFAVGICLILWGFSKIEGGHVWFGSGGAVLAIAFFVVVIDNFIRKTPTQTRGGIVRYEEEPGKYIAGFVIMALFGVGALFSAILAIAGMLK